MSYRFTIVIAVYNTGPYLNETVESLISQDIGFKDHVQVILVDDGSTDISDTLSDIWADKYPHNIKVIHQPNAGVSAARNAALPYIEGEIVNFLDSDDKLSKNTLSLVDEFFQAHAKETDMVSVPMHFFEGATGEHILNYKYARGTRVIDMEKEPDCIQLSLSSSFVLWERAKDKVSFDTRLKYGEDAKEALKILKGRKTLGVISEARYHYRKRKRGGSALQQSTAQEAWYFPHLEYLCVYSLENHRDEAGKIPKFIQYTIMYDLQWRFKLARKVIEDALGREKAGEFINALFATLGQIDDDIILAQKNIWASHKAMLLKKKHSIESKLAQDGEDVAISCGGLQLGHFSDCAAKWEFMRLEGDTLILEGYTGFVGIEEKDLEDIGTYLLINGTDWLECKKDISALDRVDNAEALGEDIFPSITFSSRIDTSKYESMEIKLYSFYKGLKIERKKINHGLFFPIVDVFPHAYTRLGPFLAETEGNVLKLRRASAWDFTRQEIKLWQDFRASGRPHAGKAILYRSAYHLAKRILPKDIWLVSDRINKADDNGEAFFRYLSETGRHQHSYFVLRKDSPDYQRVQAYGKLIPYHSRRHKLLQLVADKIISSAGDDFVMNPFGGERAFYWDILKRKRLIFLQHGIIKDDLSRWLGKPHRDLGMFVTSTRPEYESVLKGKYYGYGKDVVKLTGLPRYDYLENKPEKIITIMPTWRNSLGLGHDTESGRWLYAPGFEESSFFRFYNGLLNDERLLSKAREKGYTIKFLPHPNVMPILSKFTKSEGVVFCRADTRYKEVFAESSLIVTDYSSVAFDFAYLGKPVIYAQFDRKEFFQGHTYSEGYFDYKEMGMGEVEEDLPRTVDRIIEYMNCDCNMKEKYLQRVEAFFPFRDKKNSERVYDCIME
ncbi:CDP-glycerol glycerophosphotransferase family protein [Selenomonas sp. KH1T6]|uniref:CDP-glycerol glycerophosphotransferase family protein n=1 Tax=Selenomonas sp. KH1T6 TaxID=3158784 RepID=UPI0008A7C84F|nr:CDP-glycerol glycerophosphotransferase, TagB/SpsB family [Selenomonas ruminantium]